MIGHVLRLTAIALVLAGARPARAQTAGMASNLLPNASFEEGAAGGPGGWTSRSWNGGDDCRWTVATPGRTGAQCLSIASDQGSDAAWSAVVPVRSNASYRLSGWIKTRDVRGAAGALLNIQNMQHVRTRAVAGTKDWTRVATDFRTEGEAQVEVNCLFGGWGESTGQAWYDDVALECLGDAPGPGQAVVTVDTQTPASPYSRMVFGGFLEHFSDQVYGGVFDPGSPLADPDGFRMDVIAALKELKLAIVRWPGGCFASGYHWRDGVGKRRQPVPDIVWGGDDPNTFGTDEFVAWCRKVGCEPYICSNAGNGTPEEMRDWVAYCNATTGACAQLRIDAGHAAPFNVRYWSIGNENWGGHEVGAKTPAEWGPLVRTSAELMRAASPGLKLLAAATPDRGWTLPLLKAAGAQLDSVAIHEYWLPCWGENLTPDYLTCIMHAAGPDATLARVLAVLDEAGCRGRIRIAFDEWNLRGWHHPGFPRKQRSDPRDPAVAALIQAREKNAIAAQYTMADALFSASFLNACLRHAGDIEMANIAPIVNTRGPLYVHPRGIVKRTTFHVLSMYGNLLGERVAPLDVACATLRHGGRGVPTLDAVATCDAAGWKWRIALINRHPTDTLRCVVRLGDRTPGGTCRATVLAGDAPDACNDMERPERVVPQRVELAFVNGAVDLPPHSLTVAELER